MPATVYDFRSDNVGGAAPEILDALVAANAGTAAPYGDDDYTRRMTALQDLRMRPHGTAYRHAQANCIALAAPANVEALSTAMKRRTSTLMNVAGRNSSPARNSWACTARTTSWTQRTWTQP
jgi:hypothetical protein